jgi:putative ABC transport system permease protein
MVGMVAQTVTDFYFNAGPGQLALEPLGLLGGVALGTLAAGLAGLRPSWEATTVSPRQALMRSSLESDSHRAARVGAVVAVAAVVVGVALLWASRSIVASFIGVFIVLLGLSLATPLVALATARALGTLFGRRLGMIGRMAIRSIGAHLSRTGVAMAALMMALAVAVGIGLMITSFRSTVERWLQASLPADLYITTAAGGAQDAVPVDLVPESLLDEIATLPGVNGVNALRRAAVTSSAGELTVVALAMDSRSHDAFPFKGSAIDGAWEAFHAGETVLVSEPLASRTTLSVNDKLDLRAPGSEGPIPVGGVFYDYSTDRGYLLMSLDLYRRLWNDPGITAASVFVQTGVSLEEVAAEVRRALPAGSGLVVRSDAVLRTESLRVFDRTFQITGILRGLAIVVAMIGILGSLMALQLERTRELGLLRAAGLTRAQLWKLVTAQTGLMGLISGLLALPVGAAMAAMMIYVVNRRSFGWTMPMEVDPVLLIQTVAVAIVAAVLAGVLPSRRMATVSPAEALREE